jgi:hypothetical protein
MYLNKSISIRRYLVLLTLIVPLSNCTLNKNTKNVDVSGIHVDVNIKRLEKDLFILNPDSLNTAIPVLLKKYPDFLPFYLGRIMTFGDLQKQPELTLDKFHQFLKDTTTHYLFDTTIKTYPDLTFLKSGLEGAFKHYKYYYPDKKIPEVITFISYFGYGNITYDTTVLGIGLDMYLGKNFNYPDLIPEFLRQSFSKEYILANSMKVLAAMDYNFEPNDNKLLSAMINNGKQLYFTDLMLPETPDYLKMDYRKQDIEWCKKNEPEIWKFFVDKNLLYSTDANDNAQYVNPGPQTSGMPQDAPGNTGTWMGWQIVRQYMQKYPETTMDQLMKLDAPQILALSQYKPKHGLI